MPDPLPPPPLSTSDEYAQRTLRVRAAYRAFLEARLGQATRSPTRVVIGVLLLFTGVLIPVGLWLIVSGLMKRSPNGDRLAEELAFVDRAEAVMAFPLMVNSALRAPSDLAAPGLFIVCFDPRFGESIDFMGGVAIAAGDPLGLPEKLPEQDEQFLIQLMFDEEFQVSRRRRLPSSITQGHAVYAVDLGLDARWLPDRHLSDELPLVPCLAEPGEQGRIRAVPYWCAFAVPPPPWAAQTPVFIE